MNIQCPHQLFMSDHDFPTCRVHLDAHSCNSSRRFFLKKAFLLLLGGTPFYSDNLFISAATVEKKADDPDIALPGINNTLLIDSVERRVIFPGRQRRKKQTWFHPRACIFPTKNGPLGLMTMQTIAGSDFYGPVHFSTSKDLGKTWTQPTPVPSMQCSPVEGKLEMGVCDVVPEYHAQTDTVLAMGHNVYYKDGRLSKPQNMRWPVYSVRDAAGNWSKLHKLFWENFRVLQLYSCGCGQRKFLPNGDLLIPLYFSDKSLSRGGRAKVATVLASFDGRRVVIRRMGNVLELAAGRGLLEPSLATLDDIHYMTIRAEDKRGYVTTSRDGLQWAPIRPWTWDNGTPLEMSSTQQHWLTHNDGLFLVYTRKTPENKNVKCWRAPIFAAMVDRKTMRLMRDTEITVLPLVGDGTDNSKHVALMGNFHVNNVSSSESWVTVGEILPYDNYCGNTLLARIHWKS